MGGRRLAWVDSAELKYVVPPGREAVAIDGFGLDLSELRLGRVYYVDTPELALHARGVVLRALRRPSGDQDVAVKLRPPSASQLPRGGRRRHGVAVELDVVPGMIMRTATLSCERPRGTLEAALSGREPVRKLFSKGQRALVGEVAEVDWSSVRVLGPVSVLKVAAKMRQLGSPLVAQLLRYPDDSSLLEFSTRVSPRDLAQQSIRFWTLLAQHGFDVSAAQQTKSTHSLALLNGAPPRETRERATCSG